MDVERKIMSQKHNLSITTLSFIDTGKEHDNFEL